MPRIIDSKILGKHLAHMQESLNKAIEYNNTRPGSKTDIRVKGYMVLDGLNAIQEQAAMAKLYLTED